ncbi:hypothetical protein [Sphingobium lignivorans]|uniref:Uncharacterized protein n=1 Tax=Sphingobium lignivorans TaxID=2735886 RepID=A0ABR6NHF8_9SPHN|nr:hypothetical protein [Sphingobium lignivorans]MBB5985958.1 hypothetical protein [Sphingobium lignivorans]
MRPYTTIPEVLWKVDPLVEEARRVPAWRHFHRACGKRDLFFDHVERKGKTRVYGAVAFTLGKVRDQWWSYHVADGEARSPIEAVLNAYESEAAAKYRNEETELWAQRLRDGWTPDAPAPPQPPPAAIDEFEELLGGAPAADDEDDFEDLIG